MPVEAEPSGSSFDLPILAPEADDDPAREELLRLEAEADAALAQLLSDDAAGEDEPSLFGPGSSVDEVMTLDLPKREDPIDAISTEPGVPPGPAPALAPAPVPVLAALIPAPPKPVEQRVRSTPPANVPVAPLDSSAISQTMAPISRLASSTGRDRLASTGSSASRAGTR